MKRIKVPFRNSPKKGSYGPEPDLTTLKEGVTARTIWLQGRIYWPSKGAYHVTSWYADGSVTESWEPAPKVIVEPLRIW